MNKKSEPISFFILLAAAVLMIIGHNFWRYYAVRDFRVHAFIQCNPKEQKCFVANPDIADPAFQSNPYAKVDMLATNAPPCLEEHTCSNFSCEHVLGACTISYCSDTSKEDGEECVGLNPRE